MIVKRLSNFYLLRKAQRSLRQMQRLYKRKGKHLPAAGKAELQAQLEGLRTAIFQKQVAATKSHLQQLDQSSRRFLPRTPLEKAFGFIGSLVFALLVAIVIREMWFEPFSIPTGSMRPTLKEGDYLVVSKTSFGINIPLSLSHFYFDPSLVQRGSVVVFTGKNMDIPDVDTTYFYLFPGKKQFVKRLMGKPGDSLYFYGGKIYGVDAQGNDLKDLRDPSWFETLEHIPFIRFEGKPETPRTPVSGIFSPTVFYQMNEPVAKLSMSPIGTVQGVMLAERGRSPLKNYSDLWGFKNFAMARLLTKTQVEQIHPSLVKELTKEPSGAPLYLELMHHPSLQGGTIVRDEYGRLRPDLGVSVSLLALEQKQIDAIAEHMITCRFVVKKGSAWRLGWNPKELASYLPKLPDVPDGTYEIQNGKAYEILTGDIAKELPLTHPLYRKDPERVQFFYNLGIELLNQYVPSSQNSRSHPSRYAYFREGALYLLGAPIFSKEDPALGLFLKREMEKQSISTSINPYSPFIDQGPPLTKEGTIDVDFVRKYGVKVPEKMYLALGDNHAMSADSRQFGFVSEDNLKGTVGFLFWPPGHRWGTMPQPSHPFSTVPNITVWALATLTAIGYTIYTRRKLSRPLQVFPVLKKNQTSGFNA